MLRAKADTSGVSRFQSALAGFKSALPALGIASAGVGLLALAKGATEASDEVTRLQSKLRLVTSSSAELAKVQQQIVNLARQTRTDFTAVGELYTRIARFGRELNVSQSDILKTTQAVSQALQISGATAEQASNGVIQFTQALAGGIVRAEEFNSIIETMPRLAEAMAAGLGITIGQLRKMVVEGRLASDVALGALLSQSKKLNEEFRKLEPTIGSSFSQLGSELKLFGAELLETTGIAKGLTSAVNGLASGVRGLTNQTKDVKSFFAAIKEAIPIGKLTFDNPFAGAIAAQFALRKGAIAGLQQEQESATRPKLRLPVDIKEFRVTAQRMRDEYGDLMRDLEESTRTSVERQSAEYIRLRTTLQFLRDEGKITREQFNARIEAGQRDILGLEEIDLNEIRAKYKVLKKETTELGEFMKGVWREVGRSIHSTLSDAIYEWRLSWKSLLDIARRALADITAAILTSGIKNALKNATSGGSGGSSGANYLKAIAGFFGFAAGGGRVDRPTIVGESGAELVLPPGRVMNQRQMSFAGGGGITFAPVNNINIIERENPDQTKQELAQYIELRTAQQQAEFVRVLQRSGYQVRG